MGLFLFCWFFGVLVCLFVWVLVLFSEVFLVGWFFVFFFCLFVGVLFFFVVFCLFVFVTANCLCGILFLLKYDFQKNQQPH